MVKKATLKTFDAGTYLAAVQLPGSFVYLADVPVSRAIPSVEMIAGRTVYILFADPANPSDALIVGVR